jgi:hypothetical protein
MRQRTAAFFSLFFIFIAAFFKVPFALSGGEIVERPAAPGYYFCIALEDPTPAAPKGKAYFSGVFTMLPNDLSPARDAYIKFLQEKYSYAQDPTTFNSSVPCTGTNSMEEAASVEQARLKPGKQLNPEGTIETGWRPA